MSSTSQARTLYTTIASPVGELLLTGDGESLQGLYFHEDLRRTWIDREWTRSDRPFGDAREQLGEFFAGEREAFDLALDPAGSGFQRGVWAALSEVPYGQTISYGELARRVGDGVSPRAVGRANATNPIAIVVPCHRVIGADGSLTGYAGGLERKRSLLELEGALLALAGAVD